MILSAEVQKGKVGGGRLGGREVRMGEGGRSGGQEGGQEGGQREVRREGGREVCLNRSNGKLSSLASSHPSWCKAYIIKSKNETTKEKG